MGLSFFDPLAAPRSWRRKWYLGRASRRFRLWFGTKVGRRRVRSRSQCETRSLNGMSGEHLFRTGAAIGVASRTPDVIELDDTPLILEARSLMR